MFNKLTKRMVIARNKINSNKTYEINNAITLLKELSNSSKFTESLDVAINLGIDARKTEQNIKAFTILPHGNGKLTKVAVFAQGNDALLAKEAGADLIGMQDLVELIKKNKINFDVVIASPETMPIVNQLGPCLGPRGLMPNPKMGTVTTNILDTVKNIKKGQVRYRNDKNGIVHASIGKINFTSEQLKENLESLLISLKKNKPIQSKGLFVKKISLSTTMGPSISIDKNSLNSL